ncbi:hypothetical protein PAXINDRAFT_78068 [Paxillus involutus ATCC 200175]|uniref:Peptidase A1 domain-containing protein n=1 Tax=Paxillus involutus ATCC 200175 TaxID=664439 RepID=A0A0C9TH15_PAXIN|nr:hypothetical protein PAXINDRAFT_78068 [Paxillus involutus ATCC 200175]
MSILTFERAPDQTLGVTSQQSSGFEVANFPMGGLMVMAFQSISAHGTSPVFWILVAQGQTDQPVFSFNLVAPWPRLCIGSSEFP